MCYVFTGMTSGAGLSELLSKFDKNMVWKYIVNTEIKALQAWILHSVY